MSLPKVAIWIVMAMVAITTLLCAWMVMTSRGPSETTSLILFTLLALALLAPMAVTLHRTAYSLGGIVICAVFLFLWLGLLASVCQPAFLMNRSSVAYTSAMVVLYLGIPAGAGLMCVRKPWGKWFGWSLATLAAFCIPITIVGLWISERGGSLAQKISMTGVYSFLFLAPAAALLVNVGRHDRRYFRWPGIASSLAAAIISLITIWDPKWSPDHQPWDLATYILFTAAATLALINLVLMTRSPGLVCGLKWTAVALVAITGLGVIACLVAALTRQGGDWPNAVLRAAAVAGTLATGTIVALLLARTLLRIKPPSSAPQGISRLKLHCPNCGTLQDAPLAGACPKCLLQFRILLTEPRCPACQHLVLNLTSDRCPECGAPHPPPGRSPPQDAPTQPPTPTPLPT